MLKPSEDRGAGEQGHELNAHHEPEGDTTIKTPIEIRLLVAPTRLSMSERDRFRIGLIATNTTDTAIDPHLFGVRLLVNGTQQRKRGRIYFRYATADWNHSPNKTIVPTGDSAHFLAL